MGCEIKMNIENVQKITKKDLINILSSLEQERDELKTKVSTLEYRLKKELENSEKNRSNIQTLKDSIQTYIEVKYPEQTFRDEYSIARATPVLSEDFLLLERLVRIIS